jgi:hypothetical protein
MQSIRIAALLFAASVFYSPPSPALQPLEAFVARSSKRRPTRLSAPCSLA